MNNIEFLRAMTDDELATWLRQHIYFFRDGIGDLDLAALRQKTDIAFASWLSEGYHCENYEEDDYDPAIMEWLMREVEHGKDI